MLYNAMFRFIHNIPDTTVNHGTDLVQATGRTTTALAFNDPAQYALTAVEVGYVLAGEWKEKLFDRGHWVFFQAFINRWMTPGRTLADLAAWIVAAMGNPGAAGPMAARIGMEERDLKF